MKIKNIKIDCDKNIIMFSELELSLDEIMDTIQKQPEFDIHTLHEKEIEHISELIFNLVHDDCIKQLIEPNYTSCWENTIQTEMDTYFELIPLYIDPEHKTDIYNIVQENVKIVLETQTIPRSSNINVQMKDQCTVLSKIEYLRERNKHIPKQRSSEWFAMRNNLISASSLWKVFHTEASKNQMIYEKCNGFTPYGGVNIHSPLHWGQKYENVAQMYYEYIFETTIEEYGCIPHANYPYIGASPDGLNVNPSSDRYGRLLEIKCVKNRELTGIPKKEYWIQMQTQMECCQINACDFLECRFLEYETLEAFETDGTYTKTENNQHKGLMLCFLNEQQQPIYVYQPLSYEKDESVLWVEKQMALHRNLTYVKTYYWYLEEYSCITVERNEMWFQLVLPEIDSLWKTIEYEKINGFEHRKPKQSTRISKTYVDTSADVFDSKGKCLVFHIDTQTNEYDRSLNISGV